jgi:outer membrane protein TolC
LNINVPVFSSFKATAKKQQAKLALDKSRKLSEDVVQRLILEETSLRNEVQLYLKNITTSQERLALATRIERKNQLKFKEGMVSGYTLRQAQVQLYQAQNDYLTAMQQLVLAKAKLSLLLTPITPKNK